MPFSKVAHYVELNYYPDKELLVSLVQCSHWRPRASAYLQSPLLTVITFSRVAARAFLCFVPPFASTGPFLIHFFLSPFPSFPHSPFSIHLHLYLSLSPLAHHLECRLNRKEAAFERAPLKTNLSAVRCCTGLVSSPASPTAPCTILTTKLSRTAWTPLPHLVLFPFSTAVTPVLPTSKQDAPVSHLLGAIVLTSRLLTIRPAAPHTARHPSPGG